MKKVQKILRWFMFVTIVAANSPLVYAEEIQQIIDSSQQQAYYQQSLEEAEDATVQEQTPSSSTEETTPSADTQTSEDGDAIQQPQITTDEISEEEQALREQYGEPVIESGQEQLYQVDETNFITYIGSDVKTYVDENGVEVPVDLTLYSYHTNGEHYYLPKESPVGVVLPSQVDSETPIDVVHKDEKISLYPLDKEYGQATVQENAILYNNVEGTTDVQYTVQSNGVKEEIVLAEWGGKNRFTYVLDAGAYDVSLENNQVLIREKGKTEILFVLSAPLMVDQAGATSTDIQLELDQKEGQYQVTVQASEEWLSASDRQYPVRIDPTVTVPRENVLDAVTSSVHGLYQGAGYGFVGYIDSANMGVPNAPDIGKTRMYFKINYDFKKNIPAEAKIDSATLSLYQYSDGMGTANATYGAYRLTQDFDINTITWLSSSNLSEEVAGEKAFSPAKLGYHQFDVRDAVNQWTQGLAPNYGLVVKATNETDFGGGFYTTKATTANIAQGGFTPDKAPSLTVKWSVPDPVDVNYAIGNTTVNLRTMVKTSKNGQLQFQGVLADGLTTPGAIVDYTLSDPAKKYTGQVSASYSYKYPDTSSFISAFEKGTTQYKDKLSNWQTIVPFTDPTLNALYTIDAIGQKDGKSSGKKSSDSFLIYKVTQYDTLPKIAAYYGVSLNQIAYDNRIQDMLVVKNNTLFIRNPTKNAKKPYNPPALTDNNKADIDALLMGRGLHCEFGFEPINLNTGNFYLERTDVSIKDLGGDFAIIRNYNSKAAGLNSLFGRGWSFAFNEQVTSDEKGNLYYTRSDGSILTFTKDGDRYQAPAGYDLTLTVKTVKTKKADFGNGEEEYPVKEYHITDRDQQEKVFNFYGLLTSQTDEKGNTTKLAYNKNAQLTSITSPTGLVYGVTMNDAGYIGSIQLPNGATLSYQYDEDGNLTTYTDATGAPTRYEYDKEGRMTAWYDGNGTKIIENEYDEKHRVIKQTDGTGAVSTLAYSEGQTVTTDANGQQTVYHYDEQYRTTKITYPDGTSQTKSYDKENRLASSTNEAGQTTTYTYDANGNVLTEIRFDGETKTSTYDKDNHLLSVTDFGGATTSYTYDAAGNLLTTTLADGATITNTVDKQGRILSTTDALGQTTHFAYDGAKLVKITNPLGGVSTLAYNAHNQVVSITNPRGGVTSFTYDAEGRKLSEKDADGVGTSHTFDKAGQVIGVTEGNGNTSSFSYDAFGRKISASNGEGGDYRYTYDGVGNLLSMTDAEGNTTTYTYDKRGRLLTETDALGQTITYTRDALGRVLTRTNEAGQTSTLTYDEATNQIATLTDALGQETTHSYDKSGNLIAVTYPVGTKTETTYDALGRALSYTDEAGQMVTYTYDAVGNKLTETIGDRTTSYGYDAAGNVTKITYSDQTSITYDYDVMGNVIRFTDAKGKETTYDYNAAGRLISTTDALGHKSTTAYDKNGNQVSVTDAAGNTASSVYNGQNKVSQVTDGLGNTTHFAYNQMEQLLEQTDALGGKTKYSYNELGYLTKATDANGNSTQISYTPTAQVKEVVQADGTIITNEYDDLDRLIKQTQSSGLVTEYSYDAANRLVAAKDNQELNETYTYDKAGNRLTTTDNLGQTTTYQYDQYNQLEKVTYADGTSESFTYDAVGNLVTSTDVEGNKTSYHYDPNGNLTKTVDHLERETLYSYDALNRVLTETDADGNVLSYEYDVLGNLSKVTDANQHTTSYGYDANQNLVLYTDANGHKTVLKYDPLGRLTETVAPTGSNQTFTYDAVGNKLTETTGEGNTTSYSYDSMNRLASLTRPTGGQTTYSYDETGSLSKETDPSGDVTSYVNDLYGRATSRTLPNKATYTYRYDALGRLDQQTAPQGLSKTYSYDVAGNLVKESDQSDRVTSYTYDIAGRLLTEKNALNLETTYSYDKAGNLASVTTPSGAKTTMSYTKLDQLETIKTPTGRETAMTYDPVGQLTKRTINGDREETYTYDPNGNLTEMVNALGQTEKKTYDSLNRLTAETDTAGQTSLYTYDKDSRIIKVTNDAGGQTSMTYDGNDNLTSMTAGSERISTYTYDQEDQLLTATKGSGKEASTSSYTYDSVGNLTSTTNGNGQVTKYSYDQLGNMVEKMNTLGDVETYTYDVNNQLSKVQKADGKTISYDYNKLDQLLQVDYSEKSDGQVLYAYDADGRRVSMSDLTGTTAYAFNDEGEITGVRQGDGSLIQYSYDAYGNISKLTYPDGSEVHYSYDALDRLTKVTDREGQVTTYAYNDAGDMTLIKRGDGTKSELTYDAAHRVTAIVHRDAKDKVISSYGYEYDDGNYITKETITQDGQTVVQTYTYDSLGQLHQMVIYEGKAKESAGQPLATLTYTYDQAGNKLTSTEERGGKKEETRFTYDANNRLTKLVTPTDTISYTYDKNGNRTSSGTGDAKLDYIYDTENRLLAVKDKEGLLFAALYDGEDNRVFTASRTEATNTYQLFKRKAKAKSPNTSPNGQAHSLFWYGFTQNVLQFFSGLASTQGYDWIGTFDTVSTAYHQKVAKDQATKDGLVVNPPSLGNLPGEGEVTYASQVQDVLIPYTTRTDTYNYYETRNYVNDTNQEHTQVLQTYDDQLQKRETYTYGNGRASYTDEVKGASYNYLTNVSGSTVGLTQGGQAVASSSYELYGSFKATTDRTGNPFAYNGEARDVTGFDYLRARYYDSQAGTFLTEDSYPGQQTDPLSQNGYSYVENNPVNYTDPSGHKKNPFGGVIAAMQSAVKAAKMAMMSVTVAATVMATTQAIKTTTAYVGVIVNPSRYSEEQRRRIEAEYQRLRFNQISRGLRETTNLARNWTKALSETIRHFCDPKTQKGKDDGRKPKYSQKELEDLVRRANEGDKDAIRALMGSYDYKGSVGTAAPGYYSKGAVQARAKKGWQLAGVTLGEVTGYFDAIRLFTGKDPITGKPASRIAAGASVAIDVASMVFPPAKAGKFGQAVDKIDDVVDATRGTAKAVDKVDDAVDAGRATKPLLTADDIEFSDKFSKPAYKNQVAQRGWDNQKIADTINNPVKKSTGYNKYTDSTVTNYYIDDVHYVAVDDKTGKVIQISDLNDPNWKGPSK